MSTIEHPMSITAGTLLSTGIIVGILNVFTKPDHLSSMATLSGMNISNDRSRCDSFKLGINWGIGNSISTLVVGSVLIAIESPQDGVDIQWWSIMIEAVIGVFVFGLGIFGMYNALKNKKKNDGRAWWHDESLTLKDEEAEGDEETVQCSTKSSESITRMMADVLNEDGDAASETYSKRSGGSILSRVVEESDEDNDDDIDDLFNTNSGSLDESFTKFMPKIPEPNKPVTSGRSKSFLAYQAKNKPSLSRASSFLKKHGGQDSIVSNPSISKSSEKACPCTISIPSILACIAGTLQGISVGGILSVMPSISQDARFASIYLVTVCITSTLMMGGFSLVYSSFSKWFLIGDEKRIFLIEAGSACLSLVVGVAWLVLLAIGKIDEVILL